MILQFDFFSSAFLPSSFCMYTTLVAMTGWFQDSTPLAIMGVAAGAIVGWPFSALIGYNCKPKYLVVGKTFPRQIYQNIFLFFTQLCFLCRLPIAFDLLLLKSQWKSFITWSAVALILLLVRGVFF